MKKLGITFALLVLSYCLYNADALYGQYLYSQLCDSEGGARFYKRVEKGQGWLETYVASSEDMKHMELTREPNRGFVRFIDTEGKWFDARLKSTPPYDTAMEVINSQEYTLIEPANLSTPVRYTRREITERFNPNPNVLKKQTFSKTQTQIIDLRSNEIVATHTHFGYSWTSPNRTILSAPTGVGCHIGANALTKFLENIFESGTTK